LESGPFVKNLPQLGSENSPSGEKKKSSKKSSIPGSRTQRYRDLYKLRGGNVTDTPGWIGYFMLSHSLQKIIPCSSRQVDNIKVNPDARLLNEEGCGNSKKNA
jgi:hypothetical protein